MTTETLINISLSTDGSEVLISSGVESAFSGELAHLLIAHDAALTSEGFRIPSLGFRRCSRDLASVLRESGFRVEYDAAIERLLRVHLDEIRARRQAESNSRGLEPDEVKSTVQASGRFARRLTAEQLRDVGRLLFLFHGANYSVPGAGKTAALLAVYEALRNRGDVSRLLVIAPKNAFTSWETEIGKCYQAESKPSIIRLTGGRSGVESALAQGHEVSLITYQLLPNVLDIVQKWLRSEPTHVVLDESHRIKGGFEGVIARSTLRLSDIAQRRDILSGTPLPHAPEDLRPQLDFLWPGQRILPEIRLITESPIEVLTSVQTAVRPLYVRTTKRELNLPRLDVVPITVELGPFQRELYDLLRSEARRLATGMPAADRQFLRSLGRHVVRLLQAASNPMLLAQNELLEQETEEALPAGMRAWQLLRDFSRHETPAKISEVVRRTNEVLATDAKAKVVIWTSFILNINLLEGLLQERNPVTLHGAVETGDAGDPKTREGRIRKFHEDASCRVFIANPAAGGEGISLHHAAHHAIYLDRTFNAAHYLQSLDRIHRLGLPPDAVTRVEIVEARETIDQKVAQRMLLKLRTMAHILDDPGLAELAYDPEDIVEEFPGGIDSEDVEEIVDHLFVRDDHA